MKRILKIPTIILLIAIIAMYSFANAGTAENPLVSLKYLDTIFINPFMDFLDDKFDNSNSDVSEQLEKDMEAQKESAFQKISYEQAIKSQITNEVKEKMQNTQTSNSKTVTLQIGQKVYGDVGTKMIILQGSANLFGNMGDAINLTRGSQANVGTAAPLNTNYFFTSNYTSGFEATSDNTQILITNSYKTSDVYTVTNTKYAQALFDLSLFKGTNDGFDLQNQGDRLVGLIMLIRLMGQEQQALNHSGQTPFTDLSGWLEGHKYIGYGFDTKITNGTNSENTTFSPESPLSLKMYLTFVLRALGYNDAQGDFNWETSSIKKSIEVGLITQNDVDLIGENPLYRDNIVKISYNALNAKLKNSSQTLAQKLIVDGIFTQNQFNTVAQNLLDD